MDWEPEDRAKALAYVFEQSERCSMCGTSGWEWEANKRAYEPVLRTCLGCYYKEIAREGQEIGPGVTVMLEKPGTMQSAQRQVRAMRLARRDSREARSRSEQT
jgi:hypothetical protein